MTEKRVFKRAADYVILVVSVNSGVHDFAFMLISFRYLSTAARLEMNYIYS
jgi:hypothetical protein